MGPEQGAYRKGRTTLELLRHEQSMNDANTIVRAFAAQVEATPNNIAVCDESRSLSYAQLDQLSNAIVAQFPQSLQGLADSKPSTGTSVDTKANTSAPIATSPQFVGLIMNHGVEMIAALLAILKSGAAYVPAEPNFPPERVRYMMKECGAAFVVTQQNHANYFADSLEGLALVLVEQGMQVDEAALFGKANEAYKSLATPESLAYVLYTSGTTGHPKGVMVEHRNVCHYVRAFKQEFKLLEADIVLQNSVCTFDIFVEEVFPVLLSGGSLAVPNASTRNNLASLVNFIDQQGVTIISGFPYLLNDLNKLDSLPESVRLLISGGDVLRAQYVTNLIDKVPVYNTYGPTETTVCASYFHCNKYEPLEDGSYPVGKAIRGVQISLLDENLKSVKEGQVGEICISGGGVSRGYLGGRSENKSFVVSKEGTELYRSGDLGRMLPDGNLHFLKRNDKQVMIGGKRVEPQEVELVLGRNTHVEQAVVKADVDSSGLAYLTAYIVPTEEGVWESKLSEQDSSGRKTPIQGVSSGETSRQNAFDQLTISQLQEYLEKHVPRYMIPENFVMLREMPLTPNGKIDRQALSVVAK